MTVELGDREPWGYREDDVKAAIAAAFLPADSILNVNSQETSQAGGLCLSPRFSNRLAIRDAMLHVLTGPQYLVLWHRFVHDRTQDETARQLHSNRNAVAVDEAAALQALVRVFWEEPSYVSPPRVRRRNAFADVLYTKIHRRAS